MAIDAPFGWPQPFIDFVSGSAAAHEPTVWDSARRDFLCFRRTDQLVRGLFGRPPLSVSADKIAITAMRCDGLLRRLEVTDRYRDERVVEVYPAVALHMWGFRSKGYKSGAPAHRHRNEKLEELLGAVLTACPWLRMSDRNRDLCSRNDDAFDALVAALAGRAAALGLAVPPSNEDAALAKSEGWIAVPQAGTLTQLVEAVRQNARPAKA